MKHLALTVAIALVAGACASPEIGGSEPDNTAELMAVALTELVTKNHTFGEGPPPFTEYLILSAIDPSAGDPVESTGSETRPLSVDERSAIEEAIGEFGPVRWIENMDEWVTEDLTAVVEGAAIIGVGEPILDEDGALVPVSLWCGGLCGTWFTYRLRIVDGEWTVTGIEGPIAIS